MARPEITGQKFLSKLTVAGRYDVTPRSIDRWVRAQLFPPSDFVVNGRHYWLERGLDRHDRRCAVERAAKDQPTSTPDQETAA